MKIDITNLRELTDKAIKEGNQDAKRKEELAQKAEEHRHEMAKRWAEGIALSVPDLCKDAASKGKNIVKVIDNKGDYRAVKSANGENHVIWNLNANGLRYSFLQKILEDAGLKVTVKFAHDGVGIESWYDMYVEW